MSVITWLCWHSGWCRSRWPWLMDAIVRRPGYARTGSSELHGIWQTRWSRSGISGSSGWYRPFNHECQLLYHPECQHCQVIDDMVQLCGLRVPVTLVLNRDLHQFCCLYAYDITQTGDRILSTCCANRKHARALFLASFLLLFHTHTNAHSDTQTHSFTRSISHSALQEVGRRRLRNTVLGYLSCDKSEEAAQRAKKQYDQADCMTDRVAGLGLLANMGELSWYLDNMEMWYIHTCI